MAIRFEILTVGKRFPHTLWTYCRESRTIIKHRIIRISYAKRLEKRERLIIFILGSHPESLPKARLGNNTQSRAAWQGDIPQFGKQLLRLVLAVPGAVSSCCQAWGNRFRSLAMNLEEKLKELGLRLPPAPSPAGNYIPAVRAGNLIFMAGTLPILDGQVTHLGKVGEERTVEEGYEAAKVCALNSLASLHAAAGGLDKVKRIVLVNGFVNGAAGFSESPRVLNGASDLFVALLGEKGKHARAAVAVAGLPRNATVEIQVVAEV